MPFYQEQKDILELQFEAPNVNFLIDEESEVIKFYGLTKRMDFSEFYKRYSEGRGAVAYKPEVLFAIIVLSLLEGILSSRAIEEKCKRDIYYIYITEYRKPDHSTIARFLKKFRKEITGLLPQLIRIAKEMQLSQFNTIAIDGSKFQSSSSKKNSYRMSGLEKEEKQIQKRINKLMNILQENDKLESKNEKEIKKWKAAQENLKRRQQKLEAGRIELAERQKLIEDKDHRKNHQINILEPDARMMKEINASGYNVQISVDTESELVVNASIESDRSDNNQFGKQHEKTEEVLGKNKKREYLSDGGYMSTSTMDYMGDNKVNAYINDAREKEVIPTVEELLKRGKKIISEFFVYHKANNEYVCPNKRKLKQIKPGVYESENCRDCILKDLCTEKRELRRITRTEFTERKDLMREKLKASPEKMNERKAVERVFGNIKWNLGLRRFSRKGFEGAAVEFMMIILALNIKKLMKFLVLYYKGLWVRYRSVRVLSNNLCFTI